MENDIYNQLIITLDQKAVNTKMKIYPVNKVEIKDSSGAGDTFIAGLVANIWKIMILRQAIRLCKRMRHKGRAKEGVSVV